MVRDKNKLTRVTKKAYFRVYRLRNAGNSNRNSNKKNLMIG